MRRVEVGVDANELLARICERFGVERADLCRRRSVDDARLMAARLLKDETNLTGREVGQRLGLVDGSGLGNLLATADRRLGDDRKLRRTLAELRHTG